MAASTPATKTSPRSHELAEQVVGLNPSSASLISDESTLTFGWKLSDFDLLVIMEYSDVKEIDTEIDSVEYVQEELRKGWVLLGIRTKRPIPKSDGSFEDITTYILAKPILEASIDE